MTTGRLAASVVLAPAATTQVMLGSAAASAAQPTGVEARTISEATADTPDPGCGFA